MKKIIFYALMCMSITLISCDKLKEATSIDFKVNDVSFDFETTSTTGTSSMPSDAMTLRAAATQSFAVTRTVNISEMGSSDVTEYADKIIKVRVDNSLIKVTVNPTGTYTIENLTIKAVGVSGSILVPSYTIGNTFTLTSEMNAFTNAFILKLLNDKSISVTVTGRTDAPVGTTINISYESDLFFTASLL